MSYYRADPASKILESVLEDMNNIMKGDQINSVNNNGYAYDGIENDNNNCMDLSPDKKFELMLEELQNCLQETADTRSVMQNLSSDKKEFVKSLIRNDYDSSNHSISHRADLMNEISKLKLDITYLQRDKQDLLNQITDLNTKLGVLDEENVRLKHEIKMMRVDEMDYCIPPTENYVEPSADNLTKGPNSYAMSAENPIATSTPEKSKINQTIPEVPPHGNQQRFDNISEELSIDFIQKMSPVFNIKEHDGKSSSWSELRTHKVVQNDVSAMTPPSQRKNSMSSRSFGKGDSGSELKKKMKNMKYKRCSQPDPYNTIEENPSTTGHFHRQHPLRMTAGPRLANNTRANTLKPVQHNNGKIHSAEIAVQRVLSHSNPNLPNITLLPSRSDFRQWTKDHVCGFLHQIGLGAYANNCRRWLQEGQQLLDSSRKEIEKELNITNKMHMKKLLIHVRQLTSMHVTAATYFSLARPGLSVATSFNIRLWLDDIGLLQYLNVFTMAGVDAYVLDQLSLEDVQHLKVTAELHVASLRRGIQLLRAIDYDLTLLIRRPTDDQLAAAEAAAAREPDDEDGDNSSNTPGFSVGPGEVCRWTQHQVMEWLRRIELPEYASNLRGSGIHGALMILEDRFNATSLASVLNIPQSKSLLRRHLQAKFNELIGPKIYAKKKVAAESSDFTPLTITTKMKFNRRRSFFSVIKRKPNSDAAEEILVSYSTKINDVDLMLKPSIDSRGVSPAYNTSDNMDATI